MANTVNITTLADSDRNVIVRVYLASDGAEGDLSSQILIDASALTPIPVNLHLRCMNWSFTGFQANLLWDQVPDDPIIHLPSGFAEEFDFSRFGGIPNNPTVYGYTGDLIITTTGFDTAGDEGSLVIECTKQ